MPATTPEPGSPANKRVLIVDDHSLMRRGLAALIESESNLAVCGEAISCEAGLKAIRDHQPDLVIVDLELEGSNGLDLVKALKKNYPAIPALVLSMHKETLYAERSLRAGARGYVSKQQLDKTVMVAIHRVLTGKIYLSDSLEKQLAAKFVDGKTLDTDIPEVALTDRELQVFRSIGQGYSTRQIANTLNLSVKTIESHRGHIKRKLNIESTEKLAHRAIQWIETSQSN